MARESISIQVHPNKEQEAIDEYQAFGWELQNSESVSKLSSDEKYIKIKYSTKLIFSREKTMQNYDQLVELERHYRNIKIPENPDMSYIITSLFLGIITLWFSICSFSDYIGLAIVSLFFSAGFLIVGYTQIKLKIKYKKEYPSIASKRKDILQKAKNLCP